MNGGIKSVPSVSMKISITDGILRVDNSPTDTTYFLNNAVEIIKAAVQKADLTHATYEIISAFFFKNEGVINDRINNGIVETPNLVGRFIVSTAFERWIAINKNINRLPSTLHWLDPCSGAGVFPCEILKFYIDVLQAKEVSDLPFITIVELSSIGLISTLCLVRLTLERKGLLFSEYLESGRITLLLGDSLSFFPEQHDIFSQRKAFNIVVGNPPYVRSTRLKIDYKKKLAALFPDTFNGSADLYTYFVASGIANLERYGVLAFISSAGYVRAKNGQSLRGLIAKSASVDTFIDLDETRVFENADLHSAIYTLIKGASQSSTVRYLHIDNGKDLNRMCCGEVLPSPAVFEQPVDHGWAFHSSELSLQTFSELFAGCKSLSELGLTVYSGIRPGYSKAYIIDQAEYEKFDPDIRAKWFKPTILPANIKRWYGAKHGHFMLIIPSGTLQIDDELMRYLMPYREKLASRTESKNANEWFTLRPCSYYNKMDLRKIAFPDLSAQQRFSLVNAGVYVPDGSYFIDSENLVLLGILNSSLAREYFVKRCSSVGSLSSKGRFRFKKSFVQSFPVPLNYTNKGTTQVSINRLVQKMVDVGETEKDRVELDRLVSKLYQEAK